MAVPVPPLVLPYSPNSTDASWKAAKTDSIRDKWNTELGAALRAAQLAYGKIKFDVLDCGMYRTKHGQFGVAADVDVAKKAAQAHYNVAVKPAIKALDTAKSKAAWAGRNLVISKAANTKAKAIAADLTARLAQLKGITFDDFDTEKARLVNAFTVSYNNFNVAMTNCLNRADTLITTVRGNPTPAQFNLLIAKAARGLTQNMGNAQKLKKNGLDLGKADPTAIVAGWEDWAQGRNQLPATASRTKVLATVFDFERKLNGVKAWWA